MLPLCIQELRLSEFRILSLLGLSRGDQRPMTPTSRFLLFSLLLDIKNLFRVVRLILQLLFWKRSLFHFLKVLQVLRWGIKKRNVFGKNMNILFYCRGQNNVISMMDVNDDSETVLNKAVSGLMFNLQVTR